jgi:hypothetical protein
MILREGRSGALNYSAKEPNNWVEQEAGDCEFEDVRLGRRLVSLLGQIGGSVGESIPVACQDWANAKAAYRFFSNERVSEKDILAGIFGRHMIAFRQMTVSFLSCTTRRSSRFSGSEPKRSASRTRSAVGASIEGVPAITPFAKFLMHSSLAVTTEGLPLGLCAVKFWSRHASPSRRRRAAHESQKN